jgi:GH15 family glucan-1,4-alpha-glucosidase
MPYRPIEDAAVIGNLHTVALVATDGTIDFMSYPRFDSPTIFASLLDDAKGGRFRLAPLLDHARQKQMYLPDTNVLLTRFLAEDGVAEVSDYMPIEGDGEGTHRLVRRVKTVRGEIRYRLHFEPRFDYARAAHRVELRPNEAIFTSTGDDRTALRLRVPVPCRVEDGALVADFTLKAGEHASFVLEPANGGDGESPSADVARYVAESFKATVNFWHRWVARSTYRGRWREMVVRSALTLKLLTSSRFGSMVASPTFGLPEKVGGPRNWDYRYTWIRDASFTLYALMRLGYTGEAGAFMGWVDARCHEPNPDGSLQIAYGIDGRHDLTEQTLGHLEGYRGSSPVRIGNDAHDQLQLDIYGELLDSAHIYDKYGSPISYDLWSHLVRLVDWVGKNRRLKDEGIWEVRGGRHEFLFSRVLSWVAVDRAIRIADRRGLPAPIARWRRLRREIYLEVQNDFFDAKLGAFVQSRECRVLDASALIMPLVKFIGPTDPRWLSTLAAIERDLADDSLIYRYRAREAAPDGLSGDEGTFSMCTFWFVECLSRAGDLRKARFFFEKMLGYSNHVGLFAEELGPSGEHLGNFPQAFTHVALVSAAYDLDRRLSLAGED